MIKKQHINKIIVFCILFLVSILFLKFVIVRKKKHRLKQKDILQY